MLWVACVASFGVNTDYSVAGWAFPFLLFIFQKVVHAVVFDVVEVFNQAQPILFPICAVNSC